MLLKNFFSRLMSGQPAPSRPKTSGAINSSDSVHDHVRRLREMSGAQPSQKEEAAPYDYVYRQHPRENDKIPTELKFATYRDGPSCLRVAYAIFYGNRCVFTSVGRGGGSSINLGEDVAQVIARREGRPLESLRFYDLQTTTGYGRGGGDGVGGMEFDEIILGCERSYPQGLFIKGWIQTECPDYVMEMFKKYVADSRPQAPSESNAKDF